MAKYLYIGAAWKKKGKNGTFLSFSVDKEKVAQAPADDKGRIQATLYENNKKTKDSQPDYNLAVKVEDSSDNSGDLPF